MVNNYREFLPYLHLRGSLVKSAAPYRRVRRDGRGGCQIDLLIQTERAVCIVEAKRMNRISREIADEVDRKVNSISRRPGMTARTALVYDGELMPGVESDGYFDAIVPFRSLLGL